MRNRMYGGVRGRKTKVGEKLLRFPPTRLKICDSHGARTHDPNIKSVVLYQLS